MARWFDRQLQDAINYIENAKCVIEEVVSIQKGRLEATPETLQTSIRYEIMENRLADFEMALDMISGIIDDLLAIE